MPADTQASLSYEEYSDILVVTEREDVAEGVVALTLSHPSGQELPEWTPGAHIDLRLSDLGVTRQYSLCGSTRDRARWRIGVLRVPNSRGGSIYVHDRLQVGAEVEVRGPRNHFPLLDSPNYLFIAGGIGITPLLPMIATADRVGAKWELHYGGRHRGSLAFLDELEQYGGAVSVYCDDASGRIDLPTLVGRPHEDTLIYCCGPEGLLQAVQSAAQAWPTGKFHAERFTPKDVEAPAGALESFEVICQRSGVTLQVSGDKSILDVARDAGLNVLSSCLEGTCGTCEQDIIEGAADHRDSVLTEEEQEANESLMICVSRSLSPRLILDL
jgi:ferredoxin-NADP reductase